jgi:hypothetical protein
LYLPHWRIDPQEREMKYVIYQRDYDGLFFVGVFKKKADGKYYECIGSDYVSPEPYEEIYPDTVIYPGNEESMR